MDLTVWLAIFSTLLAISAFTVGILFQLRTMNYHNYVTHCLNDFSHREHNPKIAYVYNYYWKKIYKKETQNFSTAWKVALFSTGLVGIGWLSIVICSIIENFGRECICALVVYIVLAVVAILFLVSSVTIIICRHKDHIFGVVDHEEGITKIIEQFNKEHPN